MRNNKNNITFNVRNITLNSKILTAHFTGKRKIITFSLIILILSFINITLYFQSNSVSALSYQRSVNIGFTFGPTLSVSLSSSDLAILNLTPGSSSDSNSINISVATNAAFGYTLSAGTDSEDLVNNVSNDKFSSIGANVDLASLTTDNTWGYSTSLNNGASWSSYSGLSNGMDKTLLVTKVNNATTGIDTIDFKIAAKSSNAQPSGTYNGVITFAAVTNLVPPTLYETVQSLVKKDNLGNERTQTVDDLKAPITAPTSTNHEEDASNSGVYKYDSDLYGEASDASIGYNIYYYRGILEPGNETHGSSGTATTYPNYVKLANDTCWRIVRTTGSGGVKMIYNGVWDSANSTCANNGDETIVGKSAFNINSRQAVAVGYTYNRLYANNDEIDRLAADLYGTDINFIGNTVNSAIKNYIENTWYGNVMGDGYERLLEPSAGYCNDRSIYNTENELLDENITYIAQYSTDTTQYYFGSYVRNSTINHSPSLTCLRNVVDLYTTYGADNGNKQLARPVALLTADEASLAGAGQCWGSGSSNNSYNSFLSGGATYIMSAFARKTNGFAYNYMMTGRSCILNNNDPVATNTGIRPVVSLRSNILTLDGLGTATDPWIVE